MAINQKRILFFSAVILLMFLILNQLLLAKELFEESNLLQTEIKKQKDLNIILKRKYQQDRKTKKLDTNFQGSDLKESTAEILETIATFKLRLIDYSSGSSELNLNLRGDFYAMLQFIQYLESQIKGLQITEFKIKSSGKNLFLFLKMKNGLI